MRDDAIAAADRCPRCGGGFHCGVNDAAPCACTMIRLDAKQLEQLRADYRGCLCLACLAAVATSETNPEGDRGKQEGRRSPSDWPAGKVS